MQDKSKAHEGLKAKLADRAYDAVADPRQLGQFFAAWDLYMEQCKADAHQGEFKHLTDPAIKVHFQRGVELFDRIGRSGSKFEPQTYVDNFPGPAIILDQRGGVVAQNSGPGSAAPRWRTLADVPVDKEARDRIRQWVLNDQGKRAPFVFVPCFWGGSQIRTCLLSIEIDTATLTGSTSRDVYFLISSIDLAMGDAATKAFATAYDLSQAEAEIAMLLSQGLPPESIAKNRKVSINTIRSQLRSLLTKTNAWGIQDLVRVCCNFSAHYNQMQRPLLPEVSRAPVSPNIREAVLTLPDGRQLAYLDMGPLDGDPAILFHSIISGPFLTPGAIEACTDSNIRIIAPSLAGYGKSSANPDLLDSEFVACAVSDARMLLSHLGVETVAVLGHVVGAVCAQRFARDNPRMTRSLVMVSFATHFDPSFFDDMKATQRIVGKTVLNMRWALPFIVRASIGLLDTGDSTSLIRLIHDPNEFDWKDLLNPAIREVVLSGIRHCVEQGPEPFCQYSPVSVTDWIDEGEGVEAPVTLFQGEEDTMVVSKFYDPYVAAYPLTRLVRVKNGGKFLFYTHWHEILNALRPNTGNTQ